MIAVVGVGVVVVVVAGVVVVVGDGVGVVGVVVGVGVVVAGGVVVVVVLFGEFAHYTSCATATLHHLQERMLTFKVQHQH